MKKRRWCKAIDSDLLHAIFKDYNAGVTGRELCEKYRMSRTTLYRWIGNHGKGAPTEANPVELRAQIARLERCIARMALELSAERSERDDYRTDRDLRDRAVAVEHANRAMDTRTN